MAYLTGCDDENYMHQKYLDMGETLYTGKVDSVKFSAGNERVKFTWMLNSDPRIDRCIFYWNEGKDSSIVSVNRTGPGNLDMETVLNVSEGIYTFSLTTGDDEGHRSMKAERTVQVYGPAYISRLTNRNMSVAFSDGQWTVNWIKVESELIQYTTLRYTDYSEPANPVPKSIRVDDGGYTETVLEGAREGDVFSISSSYLPEGGLDIMDAPPVEYTIR
jgi:hypothetical protein